MAFWSAKSLPKPFSPEKGEAVLKTLIEQATECSNSRLLKRLKQGENKVLIVSLAGNSDFLGQLMVRNPFFLTKLFTKTPLDLLDALLEKTTEKCALTTGRPAFMALLRKLKSHAALLIAAADIAGTWTLEETTEALTRLADLALQLSLAHILHEKMAIGDLPWPEGDPEMAHPRLARDCGFVTLSLGKLGARALNYSSDVDLILLYDEEKINYQGSQNPRHFFTKIAQSLVGLMADRTADGYVFRVDLRLRPDPGTTPPAVSFAAAEVYYQSMAET